MTEAVRSFLEIALELQVFDHQASQELQAEADRRGVSPVQLVVQKGLLNLQQIDVIETLRQPHTSIPGYEILNVLGQGGMGVVYKALQASMKREVALKTILLSQREDPTCVTRFEQEAQTVGRLAHPHIITAYDFGRHEGRLYLAMELVTGTDLARYIDQYAPLDEATAWGLIRQAAAGLAHAAAHGIVHRDIKPANLLLVEPPAGFPLPPGMPMVKIADFGLAFLTQDVEEQQTRLTAVNTTVGSPHYMAPEQLTGAVVDFRSDIYALGCTAYCMLAGVPPFQGLKLPQIIAGKLTTGPTPIGALRPDLSAESEQLLNDLMSRNPAERVASYQQLFARLEPWSGGPRTVRINASALAATQVMPTVTPPAELGTDAIGSGTLTEVPSPPKPARTRTLWVGILALGLLGTALGAGYFFISGERDLNENLPGPVTPPPPRVPVLWQQQLFNGKDITNWETYSGGWLRGENDDGARVIEGSDGLIGQSLVKAGTGPLTRFRLELVAQAKTAKAVELHFAIDSENDPHGLRLVLRLETNSARLGTAPGDQGPFQAMEQIVPVSIDLSQLTSIRLESQNNFLWISVNNQRVGELPYPPVTLLPEFRLRVEGGTAWFSDVTLSELEPPPQPPH